MRRGRADCAPPARRASFPAGPGAAGAVAERAGAPDPDQGPLFDD